MKKIAYLALLSATALLSACSSMTSEAGSWFDYNNQVVNTILEPNQGSQGNYQESRKYYVTPEDQQKYEEINNRVSQRQQSLQSASKPTGTGYAPSASDQSIVQSPLNNPPVSSGSSTLVIPTTPSTVPTVIVPATNTIPDNTMQN